MSRSSDPGPGVREWAGAVGRAGAAGRAGSGRAAACARALLATVVPRDVEAGPDVENAEPGAEPDVAPGRWRHHRDQPEEHEEPADDADGRDAERAAGEDAGAVEQQPRRRHGAVGARGPQC